MNKVVPHILPLVLLSIAFFPSCKAVDNATGVNNANVGQSLSQSSGALTRKELALKLRRLAMSYLGDVPEACEKIAASDLPIEQRLLALRIRANSADSVIAIAADPDPQVALLNMVTVLTLQRIMAEQRAEDFFGERCGLYIDSTRVMEEEAWKLAAQVLDEEEIKQLRELIVQYRSDHPDEVYVWWVRFSEFSGYKEQFSIASLGRGVVDLFVPVGDAVSGIETTTDVAERAAWLAARQSLIIQWRLELTYLQSLSAPETASLIDDVNRVAATIEALPSRLAEERKAVLQAIEDQEAALNKLITQTHDVVRDVKATTQEANKIVDGVEGVIQSADQTVASISKTIGQAEASIASAKEILPETEAALAQLDTTSASLNETIKTLDAFTRQLESEEGAPPGRPFDITEYTQAVSEAGKTVTELNALINNIDQTTDPDRLENTLGPLKNQISMLIWQAGFVFLAVGLILVLVVKWVPRRSR